jgi:hypothetical protein
MTDEEISRCRKNTDWPSDCQTCPGRSRCDELVRAEWQREFGLEPPKDLPTAPGEWVRARGGAKWEVK